MTEGEVLERCHAATAADLGCVDPDALTFGRFSRATLVDALNDAESCKHQGGYFTVHGPWADLTISFHGGKIDIDGARLTR